MDENMIDLIKDLIDEKIVSTKDEVIIRRILLGYKAQQLKIIESIDEILKEL